MTDGRTDRQTDICYSRVAFATENCTEFSEGAWIATNHTLIDDRDFPGAHWIVEEGIYLLGGSATSDLTSELVKFNGEVVANPITVKYAIE